MSLADDIDTRAGPRRGWVLQLVLARSQIGQGKGAELLERKTDELLDRLNHLDRAAV